MKDLRDWITKVDDAGELKGVEGADWDLEMGYILEASVRGEDASVLLFDHIKGYPPGYRVISATLNTPSLTALTLNLPNGSKRELVDRVRHKIPEWEAGADD